MVRTIWETPWVPTPWARTGCETGNRSKTREAMSSTDGQRAGGAGPGIDLHAPQGPGRQGGSGSGSGFGGEGGGDGGRPSRRSLLAASAEKLDRLAGLAHWLTGHGSPPPPPVDDGKRAGWPDRSARPVLACSHALSVYRPISWSRRLFFRWKRNGRDPIRLVVAAKRR